MYIVSPGRYMELGIHRLTALTIGPVMSHNRQSCIDA